MKQANAQKGMGSRIHPLDAYNFIRADAAATSIVKLPNR
jgi:hypothetical protein